MAQIVIEVNDVPTLFSPVLAHALEPGDLVYDAECDAGPWRTPLVEHADGVTFIEFPGHNGGVYTGSNRPVLRAVGARASRGGAR